MQEIRQLHINAVLILVMMLAVIAAVFRTPETVAAFIAAVVLMGFLHFLERSRVDKLDDLKKRILGTLEAHEKSTQEEFTALAKQIETQKNRIDGIAIARSMSR